MFTNPTSYMIFYVLFTASPPQSSAGNGVLTVGRDELLSNVLKMMVERNVWKANTFNSFDCLLRAMLWLYAIFIKFLLYMRFFMNSYWVCQFLPNIVNAFTDLLTWLIWYVLGRNVTTSLCVCFEFVTFLHSHVNWWSVI